MSSQIDFLTLGKGRPVLFLHGFCEGKEMWDEFVHPLSHHYQLFLLDLPGFGNSPLPDTALSLEMVAVQLQEWMHEQEISNPVLIGHSLGGYVIMALVELMGSAISGIGLFHSSALPDDEEKKHVRDKTYDFVQKHGVDKFIQSFVPPLFTERNRLQLEQQIDMLIQLGSASPKETVLAYILAMRNRKDRLEEWKTYQGDRLFIAGEKDTAVPIGLSRQHRFSDVIYHELDDVGHMGMFESPDICRQIIQKFLIQNSKPTA
jgi:pimeloyl-ACP methyl ester carboxylesterase